MSTIDVEDLANWWAPETPSQNQPWNVASEAPEGWAGAGDVNVIVHPLRTKQGKEEKKEEGVVRRHRQRGIVGVRGYEYLSLGQMKTEIGRCLGCEDQPCRKACPVGCNPAFFIRAAKSMRPEDLKRSAGHILAQSPMGGVCGVICPDKFCMAACPRAKLDHPIEIPTLQASIVHHAREQGVVPEFEKPKLTHPDQSVAIVGAGPAGVGAAVTLGRLGYRCEVFEARGQIGGVVNTIPGFRLPREMLQADMKHALAMAHVDKIHLNTPVNEPTALLKKHGGKFDLVLVCAGAQAELKSGFEGEEHALQAVKDILWNPTAYKLPRGKASRVVVVGGGPVSIDVATTLKAKGAKQVWLVYRRSNMEMPLSKDEHEHLAEWNIDVLPRTKVLRVVKEEEKEAPFSVECCEVDLPRKYLPDVSRDEYDGALDEATRKIPKVDAVVVAVGLKPDYPTMEVAKEDANLVIYAGDVAHGASNVVEAVGFAKRAARQADGVLKALREKIATPAFEKLPKEEEAKSDVKASYFEACPVDLTTDFFPDSPYPVFKMINPYLLSASPLTDGLDLVRKAYRAGWAGAVLKTAFHTDQGHIHIPAEYMDFEGSLTGFNADNVSGHPLQRMIAELQVLNKEWPDRLTIASTGGPMSGNLEFDKKGWQRNTRLLDEAGARAVEYSLSCPQGGDGSEGAIASQSPHVAARIVDWILEASKPEVPKIFKLTGAVTSIAPILEAIGEVIRKYQKGDKPKLAGITLANSFPSMRFREIRDEKQSARRWEQGVVMGMAGKGVLPVSFLTLAEASQVKTWTFPISGNGGLTHHSDAAHFLALGCKNVQLCTYPTREGVDVIKHLNSGLSFLLQTRGMKSVKELIGAALPEPIRDFMELPAEKRISSCNPAQCISCGNCTRCPYDAIRLDEKTGYPVMDPSRCIGCGFCVLNCPSNALAMRPRTKEETEKMEEWHGKQTA